MRSRVLRHLAFAVLAGVSIMAFSASAGADPPSRVARLGYVSGVISFSPGGESDWVQAAVNRPLTTGDRLWSDRDGRAELQVGGAVIRMSAGTGLSILNLDDRMTQLQLTQGVLNVRVRRLARDEVFEIDTPNLAFTMRQAGDVRIEVDPDQDTTTIFVRRGSGEAYGEDAAYRIDAQQAYRFTGTGLREYRYVDVPRLDDFDRWSSDRDRGYDSSISARYVSPDVVGYQDLDAYGSWQVEADYGNVWVPARVGPGWAPYRDGHWAWIDPWGWTWIDDAPWGYAVSHYGRWANLRGTWMWVPGPVRQRAYYAPALVVFIGGANFQLSISSGSVGGVAWFPLGPREVYRPSYPVSRGYFQNINQSNTVINNTVINNYYNNSNVTNVSYANRTVRGAVVAVPVTSFVQSRQVAESAVHVPVDTIVREPLQVAPHAAPTQKSVRGAAEQREPPPARAFERPVLARTAPPEKRPGFAAQQPQLTEKAGKPLDEETRKSLKPAVTAPAPRVKVVPPRQEAPRALPAPPAARGTASSDTRGSSAEQKGPAASAGSSAPKQADPPPKAKAPAPTSQPAAQRGKSEQGGSKGDPRAQPAAPTPPPPQRTTPPNADRPPLQTAPPVPATQPAEERGKPDPGDSKADRRGPSAAPAPSQRTTPPDAAGRPPQVAAPAPAPQPAAQRGKSEPAPVGQPSGSHSPAPDAQPPRQQDTTVPKAEPGSHEAKPSKGKASDSKKGTDESEREPGDQKK